MPSKYPALPALTVAMISLFVACNKQVAKVTAQQPAPAPTRTTRASAAPSDSPAPASASPYVNAPFAQRMQDAFFNYDKVQLRPHAHSTLTEDAEFLRSYSQLGIVIEGRCAERGSQEPPREAILSRSAFPPTAFAPPASARNVPSALIATKPAGSRTAAAT